MEFEPWDKDSPEDRPDKPTFIVINLSDFAIRRLCDVTQLFEELESIGEDFPGYIPVAKVASGWHQ